ACGLISAAQPELAEAARAAKASFVAAALVVREGGALLGWAAARDQQGYYPQKAANTPHARPTHLPAAFDARLARGRWPYAVRLGCREAERSVRSNGLVPRLHGTPPSRK